MTGTPTDEQLVAAILDATATLSTREVEPRTGISSQTIKRWRRGHWSQLQAETRVKAIAYLERVGKLPEAGPVAPLPDAERQRLIGLLEEALVMLRKG